MLEADMDRAFDKIYQSFNRQGRQLRNDQERHPEYTEQLLKAVGRPDLAARNVLVTGSKGKGSTAYFIAQLLKTQPGRIGLFTSPHLLDSLERIRVDGVMIAEEDFVAAFTALQTPLDSLLRQLAPSTYIGPVGIFAALAAWHFRQQGVHWGVYETGRGALFDDVARIHHEMTVITEVLAEHVRELGPTLETIAWHKAGGITPETRVVVLGSRHPVLVHAVEDRLEHLGIAPTMTFVPDRVSVVKAHMHSEGTVFDLDFADGRHWRDIQIPAVGAVVYNLATAVAAVESLSGPLSEADVRAIAATLRWPGRGQVLSTQPFVLLDAGVRPESIAELLRQLGPFHRAILSIPDGKDRQGMVDLVSRYAERIVLTSCTNPRLGYRFAEDPPFPRTEVIPNVADALSFALFQSKPHDRIFLCGTISFVADVLRHYTLTVS